MQTLPAKKSPSFHSIRISLVDSGDNLRAMASCVAGSAVWVTGIRVVEGKHGLFVAMPARRNSDGSYTDVTFPCSKEMREEMSASILDAYHRAAENAASQSPSTGSGQAQAPVAAAA